MNRLLPAILLILIALPVSADRFQGRTFTLTDGRTNNAAPAPLVIAMHGFLGTPKSMRSKTSFDKLARHNRFVVAYVSGVKRRWNDGRSKSSKVDDVGYLSAFIKELVSLKIADPSAIFMAGHSNGGGMAMRMACDVPDMIAGVSVVATKVPQNYTCDTGKATPAIFVYGTMDPISPHEGRPAGSRLGATLSAQDSLKTWSVRNKCRHSSAVHSIDRKDDGTKATIFQYSGCTEPMQYVEIEGHGHAWPGAGPRLERVQGPTTQEVDAARLSWLFFEGLVPR
jgi:polyhydroxybutyrate depolymerase